MTDFSQLTNLELSLYIRGAVDLHSNRIDRKEDLLAANAEFKARRLSELENSYASIEKLIRLHNPERMAETRQ